MVSPPKSERDRHKSERHASLHSSTVSPPKSERDRDANVLQVIASADMYFTSYVPCPTHTSDKAKKEISANIYEKAFDPDVDNDPTRWRIENKPERVIKMSFPQCVPSTR
ncbi:hypothetical protein EVAR_63232_1 [Eumeta japonica]|uniref:Uncharacterized protein n=1 Tax=Eumeta variegata TaxID=151549 RepID=A0A4C1ZAD7_EUMVA|nr:hypothetical protein EVAR_63232_1 [Eumeta japonica]